MCNIIQGVYNKGWGGVDIIVCDVMVDHIISVKWQSEKVLEITVK